MSLNSTALPARRALRIGIVQQGRVVHEQVFSESKSVRLGSHHSADIVLAPGAVPELRTLFARTGNTWQLCLEGQDQGRISEGRVRDLAQRIASGDTKIPLDNKVRGKISLGEVTVLFQLVPAPSGAMLPGAFRPTFIDADDPVFLGSLALISSAAAVLMIWVMQQEPVQRVTLGDLSPRVTQLVFEQPRVDPPEIEVVAEVDPEGPPTEVERVEQLEAGEPGEGPEAGEAEASAASGAPKKGTDIIALFIGSRDGDESQRTDAVFGHNDQVGEDLQKLLDRTTEIQRAGVGMVVREAQELDIGEVDIHGPEVQGTQVGTGPGTSVRVTGKRPRTDDIVAGNKNELQALLRKQLAPAVKRCYDQALNRSPSHGGRIEVRLELFDGEVMELGMAHNEIDAELGHCLDRASTRWTFKGAEGTVVVPYVLSPNQ